MKELGSINSSASLLTASAGTSVPVVSALFQQMVDQFAGQTTVNRTIPSEILPEETKEELLLETEDLPAPDRGILGDLNQSTIVENRDQISIGNSQELQADEFREETVTQKNPTEHMPRFTMGQDVFRYSQSLSTAAEINKNDQDMVISQQAVFQQSLPIIGQHTAEPTDDDPAGGIDTDTLPIGNKEPQAVEERDQDRPLVVNSNQQSPVKEVPVFIVEPMATSIPVSNAMGQPERDKMVTQESMATAKVATVSRKISLHLENGPVMSAPAAESPQQSQINAQGTTVIQQPTDNGVQQGEETHERVSENLDVVQRTFDQQAQSSRLDVTYEAPQTKEMVPSITNEIEHVGHTQAEQQVSMKAADPLTRLTTLQATVIDPGISPNLKHATALSAPAVENPQRAQVNDPLAKAIQQLTENSGPQGKTITLQLVPEKLGAMQLTFAQHAEGSRLEFAFEQPQAKELVLSIKHELEQVMHKQGPDNFIVREPNAISMDRTVPSQLTFASNSFSGGENQQQRFMQQQHTNKKTDHYTHAEEETVSEQTLHAISILV